LGVVAVFNHRPRLALRRPDVVVVDPRGHHAHDDLEGARLGHLDLLDLESVLGLAEALLADHPRRHRGGQLAGTGADVGYSLDVDRHRNWTSRRFWGREQSYPRRRAADGSGAA